MFKVRMVCKDDKRVYIRVFEINSYEVDITRKKVDMDMTTYEFEYDKDGYVKTEETISIYAGDNGTCYLSDSYNGIPQILALSIDNEKIIVTPEIVDMSINNRDDKSVVEGMGW